MNDEKIQEYINLALSESMIRDLEEELLIVMKFRQEKYPSERNDKEWLDFSNFVSNRRSYRN